MLMVVFFAAYQASSQWGDILTLLAIGVLGIYMRRFGWPRPPLLIGFVLAKGAEQYLYQAVQFYGWSWMARPGVLILAAITVLSVWAGIKFGRSNIDEGGASGQVRDRRPQLAFALLVVLAAGYGVYDSLKWTFLTKLFPMTVSAATLVGALLVVAMILRQKTSPAIFDTEADAPPNWRSIEHYLVWILGLLAASALFGFLIGLGLFYIVFLHVKAKAPLWRILLLTACAIGFLIAMAWVFVLDFPSGLLQSYVELPWPLR